MVTETLFDHADALSRLAVSYEGLDAGIEVSYFRKSVNKSSRRWGDEIFLRHGKGMMWRSGNYDRPSHRQK